MTLERARALLEAPSGDRVLGHDPATGEKVLVRTGRYGPYVQLGEADPSAKKKPRTASLFTGMSSETVSLEDALRLLTLPRPVGVDPATGEEIVAHLGRYGPYLKKGSDSRSLETEEQLFTVSLEEALALYAQPKPRRGQRSSAPLRELGPAPATGAPIVIKDGRFGSYITDGEVNVTVPRGETVEGISADRAAELLADKRAKGPAKRKRGAGARSAKGASARGRAPSTRSRSAQSTNRSRGSS